MEKNHTILKKMTSNTSEIDFINQFLEIENDDYGFGDDKENENEKENATYLNRKHYLKICIST
jgi:hypothetical protein